MRMIRGYWQTMRAYLATPKGAFDARDYGRALLYMAVSSMGAVFLLKLTLGE